MIPSTFSASVDGHCVSYDDLAVTIPFHTPSDALFAAFVHKHSISLDAIDDLIVLLRTHNFSASQVTFSDAVDLFSYVAEQRRINAQQRGLKHTVNARPRVPQVVVDLVADHFAQSRVAFVREATATTAIFEQCPNRVALLNMAQVHRSWTATAQYFLHRRLVIFGEQELGFALSSPFLGPWVCELHYCTRSRQHHNTKTHQFASLMVNVLRTCTNIRHLSIQSRFNRASERVAFDKVINALPMLSSLKRLWLTHILGHREPSRDGNDPPNLLLLLQVLPKLQSLEVLALTNWVGSKRCPEPLPGPPIDEIEAPSPTLTSLSFRMRYTYGIGIHLLPFIFRPRNGFILTSLELMTWDLFHSVRPELQTAVLQALSMTLPNIVNLHLFYSMQSVLRCFDFLTCCSKLQRLTIVVDQRGLVKPLESIPVTLEHFWIHYSVLPILFPVEMDQDRCILLSIQRLPRLTGLTITVGENHSLQGEATKPVSLFEQTLAHCLEKGIELVLKLNNTEPPSFIE